MIDILIVEDVDEMREMLQGMIGEIPGCRVSGTAANCWEARLELTRRRPDLVLLDEVLPGESSHDFFTELHSESVPVLLITGIENPTHPLPTGAKGRLSKPGWDTLAQDRERFRAAILKVVDGPRSNC